jgi:hypothetical protein
MSYVISMVMGYDKGIHILHITPMVAEPFRGRCRGDARIKEKSYVICLYIQRVTVAP